MDDFGGEVYNTSTTSTATPHGGDEEEEFLYGKSTNEDGTHNAGTQEANNSIKEETNNNNNENQNTEEDSNMRGEGEGEDVSFINTHSILGKLFYKPKTNYILHSLASFLFLIESPS